MQKFILFSLITATLFSCQPSSEEGNKEQPEKEAQTYRSPLDSITDLIKEKGETPERLLYRANLYMAYENSEAARTDINLASKMDSTSAGFHETKGEWHYMVNQAPYARDEWEKCIRADPENSACIMRLAELMIAVQNYDRALELVNQQLELDKNDAQAYFMKGIVVRDKIKDTALALQYFQNAIDLDQDYIDAIDMMGVTLAQQGDSLAKFYYQRLLDLRPHRADTYFKLGVFYMNNDQPNRAIEAYTKATQLNPRDADSYYNLAYMHVELKLYDQARQYFTKAIQYGENPYKAYYGRGFTFEVVGDLMNARKDYRKSIELLPMYTPGQEALARVNGMINQN